MDIESTRNYVYNNIKSEHKKLKFSDSFNGGSTKIRRFLSAEKSKKERKSK